VKVDNLRIVQYKAGHKYVSSTERYKEAEISKLRNAVLKSHPMG
jgi:integrase/recombinase XerD